jgi:hypothetical protein
MNRKNRKRRAAGYLIPVPFAVLLLMLSGVALLYLWMCERCGILSEEIKALEIRKLALQKNYLNEEYKWLGLRSPANIQIALRRHGLLMTWPGRDQVVRLNGLRDLLSQEVAELASYRSLERVAMND